MALGILFYWVNIPENPSLKWQQIYRDIHAEMISIGITVLILGNFDQYLRIKSEKKSLILQMGSPNREFAIEAVRQLRQRGWLKDGTTMGAYLVGANLEDADLFIAHLEFADLSKAHLAGAFLEGADLAGAYLEGADLAGAVLIDAHLAGAYLVGANLEDAALSMAHLAWADLTGANLKRANLGEADLAGAHLKGADLAGAYLGEANLAGADLHVATYSDETVWPAGFNPEKAGAELLIKTEP